MRMSKSVIQIGNKVWELDYKTGRKRLVREVEFKRRKFVKDSDGWKENDGGKG
jgi:hypothetical protein